MKPNIHAELSVRKYGGKESDYQKIHDWFDQTKMHHGDMRHRAILHNSWGIFICEQIFGTFIINSDGEKVQVRDLGEDHVIQDLGRIPSLDEMINLIPEDKMNLLSRPKIRKKELSIEEFERKQQGLLDND